tara:strand:+ start:1148 stop:1507 length:360 start_codon:yes stop_codon:yes gene_type:complete
MANEQGQTVAVGSDGLLGVVFDGHIDRHPMHKAIYDLCVEIEKLPASDQQTKCVIAAGELQNPVAEIRWMAKGWTDCLRQYGAACFPDIVNGQKHFARVLMESVAEDIEAQLNPSSPNV